MMKYAEWVITGCAAAVAEEMNIRVEDVIAAAGNDVGKIVRRGRALGYDPLGNHLPDRLTETERSLRGLRYLPANDPRIERIRNDYDVARIRSNDDYWSFAAEFDDDPDFEPKATRVVRWRSNAGVEMKTTLGER
jgi:hypothetical protein